MSERYRSYICHKKSIFETIFDFIFSGAKFNQTYDSRLPIGVFYQASYSGGLGGSVRYIKTLDIGSTRVVYKEQDKEFFWGNDLIGCGTKDKREYLKEIERRISIIKDWKISIDHPIKHNDGKYHGEGVNPF